MNTDELLASVTKSFDSYQSRLAAATKDITEEQLNKPIDGFHWTIGQICEHLLLTHSGYIATLSDVLGRPSRSGPVEVSHSFFGKLIAKAAGPNGGAPVPSSLKPDPTRRFPFTILDDLREQIGTLSVLAEKAKGVPLSNVKVANPVVRWIRFNLADCFHIMDVHLEHHMRQVEANAPKAMSSS